MSKVDKDMKEAIITFIALFGIVIISTVVEIVAYCI